MKKVKLLLTMAVIVLTTMICCSMSVFALTDGDWEFQLLDNEVKITGYLGEGGDIVIPETIYGCPVTRVECKAWDKDFKYATTITYPGTVKTIENCRDFWGENTHLRKVVLNEGTEVIGENAFRWCSNLSEINIPSTVKVIDKYAFGDCKALNNIDFPVGIERINEFAFSASGLTSVDLTGRNPQYDSGIFYDCKSLAKVKFNDGIMKITDSMFKGCSVLTDIDIPASVTTIGGSAFYGCTSLEKVILPVSLKKLGYYAFYECDSLKEVVIPYGTEEIEWNVFNYCPNLKSLYIPDTVQEMYADILDHSTNAIIYCTADSKVAEICKNHDISYLTDSSVNSGIHVLYNGTRISFHSYGQNPELLNSRTLVPLRSIFEAMGAKVEWDGATNTAIAKRGSIEVKIQIGANEMYKNGKTIPVDVPAMLLNNRTMVPVRVIAEAFEADVQWNGNGKTVLITE